VQDPDSAVAPKILDGMVEAQDANRTENWFGVPTSKARRPPGIEPITRLLVSHERGAKLIGILTAPGALLSGYDDLKAAGPWLGKMGYTPDSHPHLFPEHLARQLARPDGSPPKRWRPGWGRLPTPVVWCGMPFVGCDGRVLAMPPPSCSRCTRWSVTNPIWTRRRSTR
jgi:hypothetical protein